MSIDLSFRDKLQTLSAAPALGDVCANKHGGNTESVARYEKAAAVQKESHRDVIATFRKHGNLTGKECADLLGKQFNTVSPLITELKILGVLIPTDEVRNGGRVQRLAPEYL